MARIPSVRWTGGLWFSVLLFALGLFGAPCSGLGQSASVSGSQSIASTYPFRVLEQHKVNFGQHSITFNRVVPPVFPAPVSTPTPVPAIPPWMQAVQYNQLLFFSANVYDHRFSVIQRFDGDRSWVALSNIDFNYFCANDGFVAGGTFYEIIMALEDDSSADADATTANWLTQARATLPANVPKYIIVSGTASVEDLQALDALHSYFAANSTSIIQAFQQQQAQNAARALQLKLHPPIRPNTVINYWPIRSSVYPTGSNQ